ncbi:MAG: hypothetical protein NAOJABEB_01194 [Steroidobacteraceae bacterium]|nr:hypothetical protein [Steroidobacteraceae bacterium]
MATLQSVSQQPDGFWIDSYVTAAAWFRADDGDKRIALPRYRGCASFRDNVAAPGSIRNGMPRSNGGGRSVGCCSAHFPASLEQSVIQYAGLLAARAAYHGRDDIASLHRLTPAMYLLI